MSKINRTNRLLSSTTALALVTLFASGTAAMAQSTEQTVKKTAPTPAVAAPSNDTVVVIVGSRASQRSAIDRKKNAKTATDSIVAEDIGQFPDKNVNEAISRIAGVSLDRGENGEGSGFSLRGQTGEATLVDVNGMSALNTNGALAGGAGSADGGRGSDLRELPADMIKSIDVIKGSTAATTEGGLGGSVHIETRTGLDFKKPFFQLTVDKQMNSISKQWTPEWSAIFARKFLNGRLGMNGSVSYSETQTNADQQQPQTSGNAGPSRNADFDQSADKTFSYNPALVDPTQTDGNMRVLGTGGYSSLSPINIITKSAAAKTKADCYAAFPALTQTQLNAIGLGVQQLGSVAVGSQTAAQNRTAAQTEQTNELATCLNQWNDYAPSLIRLFSKRAYERRMAAELRFDYKVNDDLTLYVTGNIKNRTVDNRDDTLNLGSPAYNQGVTLAVTTPQTPCSVSATVPSCQLPIAATSNSILQQRLVATGLGYGFYSNGFCAPTTSGTGTAQTTLGCGTESDISNAVVDASHHVTSFTLNDANANIDAIHYHTLVTSWAAQVGGRYRHENVKLDFFYGDSGSTFQRAQQRTAVNYTYGTVNAHITSSGLWSYDLPAGLDLATLPYAGLSPVIARGSGAASSVQAAVPAYTTTTAAQWGTNFNVTWRPIMSEDHEKQFKYDLTYDFENKIPFLQDMQFGMQSRNHRGDAWSGGGYQVKGATGTVGTAGYVAPILVPTENLTVNYRDCLPTATSTQSCQYGFTPSAIVGANNGALTSLSNQMSGVYTFTPTELNTLIQSSLYKRGYDFMGDLPGKGDVLGQWPLINPDVIASALTGQTFDFSCMKVCMANDGKVYEQPHFSFREKTQALYLMFDFEQKLPLDMVFNGNVGNRMVKTEVNATGFMTLAHTAIAAGWNPLTNNGAVTTSTAVLNTSLASNTTDWLPSYNLNLWILPSKLVARYYSGHVIARPAAAALLPSGTCTIDERNQADVNDTLSDDISNACTGRVGNPGLKPYKAINHNESLEWYPNKDFNISVAYFYNNVITGKPRAANLPASSFFTGSEAKDPVTGELYSDFNFTVPSYENAPGQLQRGIEFSTKMAFTSLPWLLKYTGLDFNYTKMSAIDTSGSGAVYDLVTGTANPPEKQRAFTQNAALWFDNGKLNARVTWQKQADFFDFISSCSNAINNYPTAFPQCSGQTIRTPYNPGGSNFRDGTSFLDMKMNYKINRQLEIFFQGRNIGRSLTLKTYQPYNNYSSGAPTLENISYGGARWQIGFTYRN